MLPTQVGLCARPTQMHQNLFQSMDKNKSIKGHKTTEVSQVTKQQEAHHQVGLGETRAA